MKNRKQSYSLHELKSACKIGGAPGGNCTLSFRHVLQRPQALLTVLYSCCTCIVQSLASILKTGSLRLFTFLLSTKELATSSIWTTNQKNTFWTALQIENCGFMSSTHLKLKEPFSSLDSYSATLPDLAPNLRASQSDEYYIMGQTWILAFPQMHPWKIALQPPYTTSWNVIQHAHRFIYWIKASYTSLAAELSLPLLPCTSWKKKPSIFDSSCPRFSQKHCTTPVLLIPNDHPKIWSFPPYTLPCHSCLILQNQH